MLASLVLALAPVVNGTASTGQWPAIGAIRYQGTFEGKEVDLVACTGALIAPDVVLTAAHCVDPYITGMVGLPRFALEDDAAGSATVWREVTRVVAHESAVSRAVFHIFLEEPHDVGLIFLAQPVTQVAPMRIAAPAAPALATGLATQWIGYGQTVIGDDGTRGVERFAPSAVSEIGAGELRHVGQGTPVPCVGFGDSGGPVVAMTAGAPVIVGISSHGGAESLCGGGGDIAERVDAHAAWIVAQAPAVCRTSPDACPAATGDDEGGGCAVVRRGRSPAGLVIAGALAALLARRRGKLAG